MTELRLLTLNALFKGDVRARLKALDALLAQSPYDIVCLQEVMYRGVIPRYAHRRASGGVFVKGGLVTLSQTPFRSNTFSRFAFRKPARPEWLMRKGYQLSVVDTPAGPLTVVNAHLSANRDDDWSPDNRYTRVIAAELTTLAEALAGVDHPLVVAGDFNLPRESPTLRDFRSVNGLADAMEADARPTFRPLPSWPNPPAFDHVLVRGLTATAELAFEDPVTLADGRHVYLSDHYGVAATLTLISSPSR